MIKTTEMVDIERPSSTPSQYLVVAAALIIVVAGIREAKTLVVPFLLSAVLAIILTPVLSWLQRLRVPTTIAMLLIMAVVALSGLGVGALVGKSFRDFSDPQKQAQYRVTLQHRIEDLKITIDGYGIPIPPEVFGASPPNTPKTNPTTSDAESARNEANLLNPESGLQLARTILSELGRLLSNSLVILVTVVFMLLEASRFPAKLDAALGESNSTRQHIDIVENVRRYMVIKTGTSGLTGLLMAIFLSILGIDYAMLWGLFAFLFNFVPNIGSIIAAIPPVLLAFIQPNAGLAMAIYTALGCIAINCFISYVIEPKYMGQGLGLSTLVVFLSLVFWGWVLGPVGMLLSAPLTMIIKIVLADFDDTRPLAVLMGSKAPKTSS